MALDLIRSQKRTFLRHQGEQLKEGFQWEQWQLGKLRELNKYRQTNKKIIGGYSDEIMSLIDETLKSSFRKGENNVEKTISEIKNFVIDTPDSGIDTDNLKKYTPDEIAALREAETIIEEAAKLPKATGTDTFFSVNRKKLKALQKAVKKDMGKAQNAVLRKMDDVYRQTIYKAQVYMGSGATTLDQAIDMATKDFLEQGINCIQYKDGKMVNVASWAEMALRTASHRATMLGEGSKMDEWDMHLVVITAHGNTCELCLPWQGKILIDDVYSSGKPDGVHTLLSTAIDEGLFHPNCRHSRAIYFEGITELPKPPVNDEKAVERYQAEQKQRGIERKIRKYKRLEEGSVDPQNQAKYGAKVQEWQGALRQHLKDNTYLRRDPSKVQTDIRSVNQINGARDKKQFSRYKQILGNRVPNSLEDFQYLKYNESDKWAVIKADYRKLNAYNKIIENEPAITNDLKEVSEITGVNMVGLEYRVKTKESFLRKVNTDSLHSLDTKVITDTIASTNDVIRYTYQDNPERLVESYRQVKGNLLGKGYSEVKVKNFWMDKRNPYNGVNCCYMSPQGQKFEVQFHTPESFALKDGELHKLYEEARDDSILPQRKAEIITEMFRLSAKLTRPQGIETIKPRR